MIIREDDPILMLIGFGAIGYVVLQLLKQQGGTIKVAMLFGAMFAFHTYIQA